MVYIHPEFQREHLTVTVEKRRNLKETRPRLTQDIILRDQELPKIYVEYASSGNVDLTTGRLVS
jgi:hypothetical protein